jgi:ATP-dependent helicase HrpA
MPHISYPPDLHITARRDEIVAAIRQNQVVILAGETGSGKTTQLPKMCLEALHDVRGQIGCTQPRRVAAMSVSKRVAEELNVPWGREVGCKMRFSDDTSRDTRIKFRTASCWQRSRAIPCCGTTPCSFSMKRTNAR